MKQNSVSSVLYIHLPLGNNNRVFPVGIAHLATFCKNIRPEMRQKILDLSLYKKGKERIRALQKDIKDFQPDVIAFSWRQVRCFGRDLYNDDLKGLKYCKKEDIKSWLAFACDGFRRWSDYAGSLLENIAHIRRARRYANPGALIVVGGAGFSIFHKSLLKKIHRSVMGVVGEGEGYFFDLLHNNAVSSDRPFRSDHSKINVRRDVGAIDYEYISSIYPGWAHYRGTTIGVQTNRGCGQRCIYCPDTARDRNVTAARNPAEVVKEIAAIGRVFASDRVWFTDRLTLSKDNILDFSEMLRLILERQLKIRWTGYLRPDVFTPDLAGLIVQSGLDEFIVPITSGSQRVVDALNLGINIEKVLSGCRLLKRANYRGMVTVEYTFGVIHETQDDLRRSLDVYHDIRRIFYDQPVRPVLNFCVVLPGSKLEQTLLRDNYFQSDYDSISLIPWVVRKFAYVVPSLQRIMREAYTQGYHAERGQEGTCRAERVMEHLERRARASLGSARRPEKTPVL